VLLACVTYLLLLSLLPVQCCMLILRLHAVLLQGAGAGELLTAVLGMALTGLGFVIYKQRRSISLPAVALTAIAAAAFNVMSTVGATHMVPLTHGELQQ
jgi:hypothetical protein